MRRTRGDPLPDIGRTGGTIALATFGVKRSFSGVSADEPTKGTWRSGWCRATPIEPARTWLGPAAKRKGSRCDERAAWDQATLDASGDGYTVLRAIRDGDVIVDWVVVAANELVRERWSSVIGDIIGARASRLNEAADNSELLALYAKALSSGVSQVLDAQLALPAAKGGWRRLVVTPVDQETVSVLTRDIARERSLQSALERERQPLQLRTPSSAGSTTATESDARFASRTLSVLLLGAGLVTLANSSIPHTNRVSVGALQLAGACAALLALAVLFLPWHRHFRITANCAAAATLALLVVSDHFDHYSRSRAAVAVYPVFFILLIAWTGITRSRGTATIMALVSAPALYSMLAEGAQASVGLQCLIVTMPVAALLGEVLSWNSHRARTMTGIEMRRRLHDPLTGLANRTMLSIQLDSALARARRNQGALAVLYIDLDHFKHINDTRGHGAGDDALIDIAARMNSVARETDTVARVGGDEFVVLCDGLETISDAIDIAQRLLDMADAESGLGSHDPQSMSIGIAFTATGEEDGETLLQNADLALYRAKQEGRSRFEVFGEALRDHVETRRETEKALRLGIPRDELRVYFQPIIATDDGTITSFEALARWQRPGYGLISPTEFIPIAEEAGLIAELGAWILSHACRQAATWAARWPDRHIGVAVNLSAHQLVRGDVVGLVRHALTASALDPQLLTLELTESTIIDNPQDAEQLLLSLRDLGVNLAIDDFGTGYSSLTYLRRLPINSIKIDQSFIRAIGTEKEDTAIVAAVINLARNLNLRVVAEGVETAQQLATLVHLNCAHLQGYFFSEPKPADELPALIEHIPAWTFAPARG